WELWRALGEAGCWGLCVPEAQGGLGRGLQEISLVEEVLCRHGVPMVMMAVCPALAAISISRHGTEDQRSRYLKPIIDGRSLISFAITEPNAGTNTFAIKTFARKVPGGYRLSGEKVFITGFDIADRCIVVCRTAPREDGRRTEGITLLMVDTKAEGIRKAPINIQVAKVEKQWQIYFDDVFVPEEDRLGPEGHGLGTLFDGLNPERVIVAAMCVGLGEYILEKGVAYSRDRRVFRDPIGAYQSIQHPFALAHAHLELAKLMTRKAAWEFDHGERGGMSATLAKLAASDAALEAAEAAIQAHGGNAYVKEYELLDLWAILRVQRTAPIAREMTLNHIARSALGLPKSYM
ncbi:MAG: acyl-CoA dehydrogenase, partial [Alphaproteobacteria bacterium]|nr:acyl-CoA dehydrogenase [Alphaproteobacteria bacterium]